jgi:hypothetical protein
MALGPTQSRREMSTTNLPGGVKAGRRLRLTTLQLSVNRLAKNNLGASTCRKSIDHNGLLQG